MKAARSWAVRPTVFLGHADDTGVAWSSRDRELAKSLLLAEQLECDGCGQPLTETLDSDREGWYEVHTEVCVACLAVAKHMESVKDEPGARYSVRLDPTYPAQKSSAVPE